MKKEKLLNTPITKPFAVFLYSSFIFLIIIIFMVNFFMNSYATLLNYAFGGMQLSAATQRAGAELSEEIAREGTVLLKNDSINSNGVAKNILPLAKGTKVTLLGKTSVEFIYGGTGSAALDTRKVVDLKTALENQGIEVNANVWNAYKSEVKNYPSLLPEILGQGTFAVNEVPYTKIQGAVQNSSKDFKEYAMVVLGRSGGEGIDLPNSYLYLTTTEKELLQKACAEFSHVIVLVNTNNTLQLRWLEDGKGKLIKEDVKVQENTNDFKYENNGEPTIILEDNERAKIKGVLWTGGVGVYGLNGVAAVIAGNENPSGRLPDTWAYDVMSAPANNYVGHASYTGEAFNHLEVKTNFNVYHEGIYVGYRYYESRYYDSKQNNDPNKAKDITKIQGTTQQQQEWSYNNEELGVQYPFGYGLSYTKFDYTMIDSNLTYDASKQSVAVKIEVKNAGDVPGKTTVQLYAQIPQTSMDKVQKSAIQLVGFTKTGNIDPGKTETVTIEVDVKDLRYYDISGNGGYKVAEGNYHFTTGSQTQSTDANGKVIHNNTAHAAIDEILTTGTNVKILNLQQTDIDSMEARIANTPDGQAIKNKFTGDGKYSDINTYLKNGTNSPYEYASRTDWTTFPMNLKGDSKNANAEVVNKIKGQVNLDKLKHELTVEYAKETLYKQVADNNPGWTQVATFNAKTNATVLSLIGTAGYDKTDRKTKENDLLTLAQQMSFKESTRLVRFGGYATDQVNSIGLPATEDKDGPSGFTDTFFNNAKNGTAFPAQIVVASACNVELAKRVGKQIAREAKEFKISGWYAPGLNLHRSALGGRNFEYYSEDPVLAAMLGTQTVKSAVEDGVIIYLKHIAMNDIETNRIGLGVWANEQTMREFYYSPIEDVIIDGKCNGIMTSFTRIGTRWTGHSYEFMTEILRNEWGFSGMSITDYAGKERYAEFMEIEPGLYAGSDLWLNSQNNLYTHIETAEKQKDPIFTHTLQRATKNIIYTVGTSNAMHADMGFVNHKTGKVIERMFGWQVTLLVLTVVLVVFAGAGIAYTTVRLIQKKKTN